MKSKKNKIAASSVLLASSSLLMTGCGLLSSTNQEVIAMYGVAPTKVPEPTIEFKPVRGGQVISLYAAPGHFEDDNEERFEVIDMPILMYGVQTPKKPTIREDLIMSENNSVLMYGPAPTFKNFTNSNVDTSKLVNQAEMNDMDGIPTEEKFKHKD